VLPRFEIVARRRPVRLVVPGTHLPPVAPYVAVQAELTGSAPVQLLLASGPDELVAEYDGTTVGLHVTTASGATSHRSRRHGRHQDTVAGLALALTGPQLTALTREHGRWVVRARHDLSDRIDVHDEAWLARLSAGNHGPVRRVESGTFGQLGLRDLRIVSNVDGAPYRVDDRLLLSASSSGPGSFPTAHTSVWSMDTGTFDLRHLADVFLRRPDRPGVYGDHASQLVRDGDRWLLATSTWGDFETPERGSRPGASVGVTLADTPADLLSGQHVLDTRSLALPTTGLRSVGVWDPHLVRVDDTWLVGYVNATRFFRFHPSLATGPDLDSLSLRATAADRLATEGTTLLRLGDTWRVLASDGRDGRRGQRAAFPVFDIDLRQVGTLDATYPTNLPWPSLVAEPDGGWLMVGFNGAPYGGPLVGYGSHGQVVVQRTAQ
jgi:hypothetical protein